MKVVVLFLVMTAAINAAAQPNVLLLCVDDLKPALGCYGDKTALTPHIDRLASRGVLFEKAYCNQAVCSPSRNALMTGLRPQTIGIYDLPTHFRKAAPTAITVGQYFKGNGYHTAGLGKIFHTGHGNIDDADTWSEKSWKPKAKGYALKSSTEELRQSPNGPRGAPTESADVPDDTYGDGQLALEAVARLEAAAQKPEQPFFLAVGFLKPHLPFVAPKKYWDLYDATKLPMPTSDSPPKGAPSYAPGSWSELRQYATVPSKGPLTAQQTRHLIHGYYAATSYMDAQVGKILDALDALQLADNTIVLLWGDHGWHLGDLGLWCKHSNYEQAARIPVIMAAPDAAKGAKSDALIETVDLYPTLGELAGLPAPDMIDGKSFAKVLADPAAAARDHVIHVYPRGEGLIGRAIRTATHRMVEWKKPGAPAEAAELELYDYVNAPNEPENLATKQPEMVAKLRALLATHPEAKPQFSDKKGASAKGKAKAEDKPKPSQDRAAMFKKRDKDQDGQLTKEEFLIGQPDPEEAPKRFPLFDKNGDGLLSQEEFVRGSR
jgi:iduronate 2-sulfatase